MNLANAIETYLRATGAFGLPLHLSQFGLPKSEAEQAFSVWDEDYQISRYVLLSRRPDEELASIPPESRVFVINGHECTHVIFHAGMRGFLATA